MKKQLGYGVLLLALAAIPAAAQSVNPGRTLAAGNPPLTERMVTELVEFFEWSLNMKFTRAERDEFERDRIAEWRAHDQKSIASVGELLKLRAQAVALSQEQRDKLQPQVEAQIISALRTSADDGTSQMLLKIYGRAHGAGATSDATNHSAPAGAPARSGVPPQLVGTWQAGTVSATTFVNPHTGSYAPPSGTQVMYKIFADGRYEYAALTQQSMYNCTTKLLTYKTGTVQVTNGVLTFVPQSGKFTSEDNCNRKYNYEKPATLDRETYNWRLERDQYGLKVCLQNATVNGCAYQR